jgi:Kip1 ubiquitination-promoting complex protein 1
MYSYAYDGSRCCKWNKEISTTYGKRWKTGDVVGCYLDLDDGLMSFSLNGEFLGVTLLCILGNG